MQQKNFTDSLKYAFYNSGSIHLFDPRKPVRLPSGKTINQLTMHMQLVKLHDRKDCFIVDNHNCVVVY